MEINQERSGIWQFDEEEINGGGFERGMTDIDTFVYENDSLIINLPSDTLAPGQPEDNIYRLKTKWKKYELYVFLPLSAGWHLFAVWEDDRFVMYEEEKKKLFKKVKSEEIVPSQRDLLKPGREMWRYPYINPDEVEM